MSTPEPPDPGKREIPGQPAVGADQAGAHRANPDQPTEQIPNAAGSGAEPGTPASNPSGSEPSAASPAGPNPSAGPSGANPEPASPEPAHAGFASGPAGPTGPVGPTGTGGGRRWWRPRRRWPLVTAGVIVGLLLLVLAFGAGRVSGRFHDRMAWHERVDGPGHGRMLDGPPGGPGMMGEMWHPEDGPPWSQGQGGDRGERGDRGDRGERGDRGGRGPGGDAVVGTVASVNGPTVVVNVDGGAPANVTTNERTRVFGEQRHAVGDLKPGDRVVVRSRPGQPAAGVFVTTARTMGTVSALDGDRATITEPDGLAQVVDISAITAKPVLGDRVVVRGTVADNGGTLKANSVQVLPKS